MGGPGVQRAEGRGPGRGTRQAKIREYTHCISSHSLLSLISESASTSAHCIRYTARWACRRPASLFLNGARSLLPGPPAGCRRAETARYSAYSAHQMTKHTAECLLSTSGDPAYRGPAQVAVAKAFGDSRQCPAGVDEAVTSTPAYMTLVPPPHCHTHTRNQRLWTRACTKAKLTACS